MQKKLLMALTVPVLLSGCQTWGPTWSEITGERWNRAIMNRHPGLIEMIDGRSSFVSDPIRVEPGLRRIQMQGPPMGRPGGGILVNFELKVEPCMRYYVNAQARNNIQPEFEPVVDHVEAIAGCTVTPAK